LRGEQIHINARIFAVADAFDALTSDRPYRAATSYMQARKEITVNAGTHFDPGVVNAFLNIYESEWRDICTTAQTEDYIEHVIDKREIRSFVVSLKRTTGRTGALNLSALSA
jgi:HD-GYP domain-containing protein (c-di-GMP phosphodiesterase class II)